MVLACWKPNIVLGTLSMEESSLARSHVQTTNSFQLYAPKFTFGFTPDLAHRKVKIICLCGSHLLSLNNWQSTKMTVWSFHWYSNSKSTEKVDFLTICSMHSLVDFRLFVTKHTQKFRLENFGWFSLVVQFKINTYKSFSAGFGLFDKTSWYLLSDFLPRSTAFQWMKN